MRKSLVKVLEGYEDEGQRILSWSGSGGGELTIY